MTERQGGEKVKKRLRLGPGSVLAVWLVLSLIGVGFFLHDARFWISFPGNNTEPEGAQVQIVLWASRSGHIYTDPNQPPYTPALYGPLFYETMLTLARLAYISRFDDLLFAGRLLVFLCFLGIPLLTYAWCRRAGLGVALAALSSALVLSHPAFVGWSVSFRPDFPGILLSLLAFYVVSPEEMPSLLGVIGAGVCASLAMLFKPTLLAAPAAIVLWLALQRRPRHIAAFLVSAAVPMALMLGVLSMRGEALAKEFFLLRHLPFDLPSALAILADALYDNPAGGLALGLALLSLPTMWGAPPSGRRLLALYFALSWIVALGALLQLGGFRNYLLEGWVLCAMLVPFGLERVMKSWQDAPQFFHGAALLLMVIILSLGLGNWGGNERPQQQAALAAALQGQRVFSDISYIAAHGRDPELLDPFVCRELELAGYWSAAPVVEDLRERRFNFVVLWALRQGHPKEYRGFPVLSPAIREAIRENYELYCFYGERTAVLGPKGAGPPSPETRSALIRAGCAAPQPQSFKLNL